MSSTFDKFGSKIPILSFLDCFASNQTIWETFKTISSSSSKTVTWRFPIWPFISFKIFSFIENSSKSSAFTFDIKLS